VGLRARPDLIGPSNRSQGATRRLRRRSTNDASSSRAFQEGRPF
jgi:hypothetical protein